MTDLKRLVFLAGFMASGKSTIGPALARRLGYEFVDIDDVIEASEGMSIPEIFKRNGEAYFRGVEKRALERLTRDDRKLIVALGGGTLMDQESKGLVLAKGMLVYLKASPRDIFERVKRKKDRPMLLSPEGHPLDDQQLAARVASLMSEREAHYQIAHITIHTAGAGVLDCVEEIASRLKGRIA